MGSGALGSFVLISSGTLSWHFATGLSAATIKFPVELSAESVIITDEV